MVKIKIDKCWFVTSTWVTVNYQICYVAILYRYFLAACKVSIETDNEAKIFLYFLPFASALLLIGPFSFFLSPLYFRISFFRHFQRFLRNQVKQFTTLCYPTHYIKQILYLCILYFFLLNKRKTFAWFFCTYCVILQTNIWSNLWSGHHLYIHKTAVKSLVTFVMVTFNAHETTSARPNDEAVNDMCGASSIYFEMPWYELYARASLHFHALSSSFQ